MSLYCSKSPPTVVLDLAKLKFLNCGVGRLCLHLANSLLQHDPEQVRCRFLVPSGRKALFPGYEHRCITLRSWHRQRVCAWSRYFGLRPLQDAVCDIWHWTHQDSEYWPPNARTPVVLNILDLNFLHEGKGPRKIQRRIRQLQKKVDRASCIVAISQFTANEVRRHLDIAGKPVHVVYMGVESREPLNSTRPAFLPPGEFLFAIGDIAPKKNFRVLIEFARQLPEYRIVIAGRATSDYARSMQREICQRGLRERVLMPGQVDDDDRQWLYKNCSAFLFPSLAEGFGLPVIEAMKLGRPVFMSDRASLPEIGGPLGFYWSSFEPETMVDVFRRGMQIIEAQHNYGEKLRSYANQFSWQRAAQQYTDVYRRVLADHLDATGTTATFPSARCA